MEKYTINKEDILINFLINDLKLSHKNAKKKLNNKQIIVNNKKVTQYDYKLKINDIVIITNFNCQLDEQIEIIYEDKNIIAVNKPSNLLTIGTTKEKEKTLYNKVSNYLKKNNKNAKVFVIHRLDKETSGIVMFAKSEKIKNAYQKNWNNLIKYRGYIAVVEGQLEKKQDSIMQYLKETSNYYIYPTLDKSGKQAITSYTVLKENKNYSLLNIEIKTGRKNQIRVAMKSINHPIIGDTKYGSKIKSSLFGLQANQLIFKDPITHQSIDLKIDMPKPFIKLFN